jgi:hypothetical protein
MCRDVASLRKSPFPINPYKLGADVSVELFIERPQLIQQCFQVTLERL